jgi:hypothetical protein
MSIRWNVKRLIASDAACSPAIQQISILLRLFIRECAVDLPSLKVFTIVISDEQHKSTLCLFPRILSLGDTVRTTMPSRRRGPCRARGSPSRASPVCYTSIARYRSSTTDGVSFLVALHDRRATTRYARWRFCTDLGRFPTSSSCM